MDGGDRGRGKAEKVQLDVLLVNLYQKIQGWKDIEECEQVGIQHLPYISRLFLFVFFFVLMFFKP